MLVVESLRWTVDRVHGGHRSLLRHLRASKRPTSRRTFLSCLFGWHSLSSYVWETFTAQALWIGPTTVLTARHCVVDGSGQPVDGLNITLRSGRVAPFAVAARAWYGYCMRIPAMKAMIATETSRLYR